VISGDEECDDNNTRSGDGCNALCGLEERYTCTGEPSVCILNAVEGECMEVQDVEAGVYQGDTRGCTSRYPSISGGCGNANSVAGPDQSYRIAVPPMKVLKARLDNIEGAGLNAGKVWISADPDDASNTCLQSNSEEIYWLNGGEGEREVLVTVDGLSMQDAGPYQLRLELFDPPPRVGSSCAQPVEINGSGVYEGDTTGGMQPASNVHGGVGGACVRPGGFWGYNAGPDEVYAVTVNPGERLRVNSQTTENWDHVVSIHSSCDQLELSCLAWDDFGNLEVTNDTESAQRYYVLVGGFHSYSAGPYRLEVTIE
jgi:cysteine-rich repeat protein